jgi:hypothetical protein
VPQRRTTLVTPLIRSRTDTASEVDLGFVLVVGPAPETDVPDRGRAAKRERLAVMELHEPALTAPVARPAHERTAPAVAEIDMALDGSRDVPRAGCRGATVPRLVGRRELPRASTQYVNSDE